MAAAESCENFELSTYKWCQAPKERGPVAIRCLGPESETLGSKLIIGSN